MEKKKKDENLIQATATASEKSSERGSRSPDMYIHFAAHRSFLCIEQTFQMINTKYERRQKPEWLINGGFVKELNADLFKHLQSIIVTHENAGFIER